MGWKGIKRRRTRMAAIKNVVYGILLEDERARADDHYLYSEVVRKVCPKLMYAPFYIAINDNSIPTFESVRRSRQKLQHNFEEVRPNDNVIAARELNEEVYKEFAKHG